MMNPELDTALETLRQARHQSQLAQRALHAARDVCVLADIEEDTANHVVRRIVNETTDPERVDGAHMAAARTAGAEPLAHPHRRRDD